MDNALAAALQDPLSKTARRERTLLLATSAIGIAVADAGLLRVLGNKSNRLARYFGAIGDIFRLGVRPLCDFGFSVVAKQRPISPTWCNKDIRNSKLDDFTQGGRIHVTREEEAEKVIAHFMEREMNKQRLLLTVAKPAIVVRATFDCLLPLAVSGYAIYRLVRVALGAY